MPGDLIDRTAGLRDLLVSIQAAFSNESAKVKDATGIEVNFDFDGKYKNGSLMVNDPATQGRFTLPARSHARWDEDELLRIRQSKVLAPLLEKVLGLIDEKEIRSQLVVANAVSRILKLAREATMATASEQTAALSPETMEQVNRMLDAIELQLSLELDKLERKDSTPGEVIECLDEILRGDGQERVDAVIQFHEKKLFNMVTSGTLVRTLAAVYKLIQGTSTAGWVSAFDSTDEA